MVTDDAVAELEKAAATKRKAAAAFLDKAISDKGPDSPAELYRLFQAAMFVREQHSVPMTGKVGAQLKRFAADCPAGTSRNVLARVLAHWDAFCAVLEKDHGCFKLPKV